MKKISSYSKLKEENGRLQAELFTLSTQPNSLEAFIIKTKYQSISASEKAIWHGQVNKVGGIMSGIIKTK